MISAGSRIGSLFVTACQAIVLHFQESAILTIRGIMAAASAIGAALWISVAIAADPAANGTAGASASGSMPGDEAMTCEEIYAQGMAESQREQEERSKKNEQMRAQRATTAAMMTGAMMTGGMGGTGQAAQAAAEAQADRQMAMLGAPQSNPRMEHLKQLWAQKHCVKK